LSCSHVENRIAAFHGVSKGPSHSLAYQSTLQQAYSPLRLQLEFELVFPFFLQDQVISLEGNRKTFKKAQVSHPFFAVTATSILNTVLDVFSLVLLLLLLSMPKTTAIAIATATRFHVVCNFEKALPEGASPSLRSSK